MLHDSGMKDQKAFKGAYPILHLHATWKPKNLLKKAGKTDLIAK